jgi:putative DNA-invertase from lambdoid prophage Rac
VLAAVDDFERELVIESTRAGQERARAEGTHMGRPPKSTKHQRRVIRTRRTRGETVTALGRDFNVSRATVLSVRDGSN